MASTGGWTREQSLIALNLYCQIPFGRMHSGNPEIIRAAELIGRSASALAMKLSNFASLDPAITSSGRRGLANASVADKALWSEMQADWERFAAEADHAAQSLGVADEIERAIDQTVPSEVADYSSVDKLGQVAVRVGQYSFRRAVLSAYDNRCCITGLAVPTLLVASHIRPWRIDPANRLNPRNGLCLSSLHDRSFDAGIITITKEMKVRVSTAFASERDDFFRSAISAYDGQPITLPDKFSPDEEFLAYHRERIFAG